MPDRQNTIHYKRKPLQLTICPLHISHCRQICEWRYETLYRAYEWPSWEDMKKDGIEFADSAIRDAQYSAITDYSGELIGYAQFFPMLNVTRLGLGLRPDLCGQGIGPTFVRLIAEEARRRNPYHEIDLEVYCWNERAIRAYKSAGFHIADTYERLDKGNLVECHCMVYAPEECSSGVPTAGASA